MMPKDVKPTKIKSIATTNIDELRNWFRHARGYLRYHNVTLKIIEECTWYLVFWKAHYRSGGTPKLRRLEMKSVEDFPEFLTWRKSKFRNSAEEHRLNTGTPAEHRKDTG
jgi:hypothetical protein